MLHYSPALDSALTTVGLPVALAISMFDLGLFHGDVALNITLTAINTLVAIVTLPFITGLAISYFEQGETVSMPLVEVVKVFVLILVPVGIGMVVNARGHGFAEQMDRPVRIGSALILAVLVLGIMVDQRDNIGSYIADGGCWPRCSARSASFFEIGAHNGTRAIFVAVEVPDTTEISLPAAVYWVLVFVLVALWGMFLSRPVGPRAERSVAALVPGARSGPS